MTWSRRGVALVALVCCCVLRPSGALNLLAKPATGRGGSRLFGRGDSAGRSLRQKHLQAAGILPIGSPKPRLPLAFLSATTTLGPLVASVYGGLLSGSLHAVSGPDHLAAILPRCMGQRWFRAAQVGAIWGLGHSISSFALGASFFGLKGGLGHNAMFQKLSMVSEVAVGLSLILIGAFGIREYLIARRERYEAQKAAEAQAEAVGVGAVDEQLTADIDGIFRPRSLSSLATEPPTPKPMRSRAVLVNGFLHGLSWDGTPSLAPALAFSTWGYCISFLLAYCGGTIAAMAIATASVGEASMRLSERMNDPEMIPRRLSAIASSFAVLIGLAFLARSAL